MGYILLIKSSYVCSFFRDFSFFFRPMSSLSSSYGASRPTSAKSSGTFLISELLLFNISDSSSVHGGKRVRSLYKRQPRVIVVTAFKNGDREVVAKVAAPTIKIVCILTFEQ